MTPRSIPLAVLVALSVSAAEPRIAPAADVPVKGSKARLADSPHPQGRRNLVVLADSAIDLSAVDLSVTGATIYLGPAAGLATVLDLPASAWNATGHARRI